MPSRSAPRVLTIFGVTGDLAKRLLLPSIYNLAASVVLLEEVRIVFLVGVLGADDIFLIVYHWASVTAGRYGRVVGFFTGYVPSSSIFPCLYSMPISS